MSEDLEGFTEQENSAILPSKKFSQAMEQMLLLVLTLCLIRGEWSLKGLVQDLIHISGHTAKTVGTSLTRLADLTLIAYLREGQGMRITPNLSHEFIQSLLVRLFGMDVTIFSLLSEECSLESLGFIPDNLDFASALRLFEDYSGELNFAYEKLQRWLAWIDEQERFEAKAQNCEKNSDAPDPLLEFAESLVSRLERENKNTVNELTSKQMYQIIAEELEKKRTEPPWTQGDDSSRRGLWVELE